MKKLMICLIILLLFINTIQSVSSTQDSEIVNQKISENVDLEIEVINGGIGISAIIRNNGNEDLENLNWSIALTGGLILFGKVKEGVLPKIRANDSEIIKEPFVIGIGKSTVTVSLDPGTGEIVTKKVSAKIRCIFVSILPGDEDALTAKLEKIASGFKSPTVLTNAGDSSNRLFVADLNGKIYVIENGNKVSKPFLDLSDKMVTLNPIYDERGLLGLVFHPDYENNDKFYVHYSAPKQGSGIDHESIIAEYLVSSEDPNIADPNSEKIIMRIDQPESNHNGGQLAFGKDGYLYIGLGDGGGAGDQHGTIGNGQDINTLLGSVLRIDVDGGSPYIFPADNPFVGEEGLDEIYSYGFRNPWKFSFDRSTGELYLADVGQDKYEEIDVVEKGGNYGWRIMEGNNFYDKDLLVLLGISLEDLEAPIHEYSHDLGKSIIGGYMYRGAQSPNLVGKYVFGDWSTEFMSPRGKLYYLEEIEPDNWKRYEFKLRNDKPLKRFILGFGEDEDGEIYVLTTKTPGSLLRSGEVWHIVVE